MKAKPKLSDLNAHLLCPLCKGYFIDASTLSDCLHSFCRSCLLRHLAKDRRCPKCGIEVKLYDTTTPFHSDNALQDLVYKLLPSVYKDELKRRGDFYRQFCERKKKADGSAGRVQLFDKHLVELAAFICTPDENISLAVEYVARPADFDQSASDMSSKTSLKRKRPCKDKSDKTLTFKRFFRCPAAVTVGILKKLLRYKLELTGNFEIELLQKMNEPLDDSMSLMDIAYIYSWRRNAPMQLYFTLYKADVREDEEAPELEQMPQLTREMSPLKSEPPLLTEADEPSKAPNVPTFTVALNSVNTKLFDMSQMQSAHPPIITTSTPAGGSAASPSAAAAGSRRKRKPSSPSKKTKLPSPTTEVPVLGCNGTLVSNGQIRPESKSGSKLSSESTSSTPSPVPPLQRMTGAPPIAKAPVSSAMMKEALENAKRTCYNFTGQLPMEIKKPKISPLAAKPSHLIASLSGPSVSVVSQSNGNSATTTSDSTKNATLKSMLNRPPPPMVAAPSTTVDLTMSGKNGGAVSITGCSSTPVTFTSPMSLSTLSIGHDSLTLPSPSGSVDSVGSRTSAPSLTPMLNTTTNNNVYANNISPPNPPPPPLLGVNMSKSMPVVATTTFGLVVVSDPQALFRSANTATSSAGAVPLISR
uniref:RING-type domain-containing protein n=1 Tax=Plectus sambesii TaxID=2011161 RepID=A0A914UUS2_9BILA